MIQVTDNLYRSGRPTPQELIDNKIQVVINLESGVYEDFHDDAYEHIPWDHGQFIIYKFPCSDIFPPTKKQVSAILAVIETNLALGERVLIHCLTGKDRTGFMCACFRMIVQGWSYVKAHAEWVAMGRHVWYFWWKWSLKKWARK